jgi:FkbM family methyltransferase
MSEQQSLAALRTLYHQGNLDRSLLHNLARQTSAILKGVQGDLEGSDIRKIVIEADGIYQTFSSGVSMVWQTDDWGAPPSAAFAQGTYEPEETDLMVALARGKNRFLDIGANVGWFSLHIARALNPINRIVYALEPVKGSYDVLMANIALNGLDHVIRAFNLGAGDRPGQLHFSVPKSRPGAASLIDLHPDWASEQQVCSVTTLDAFLAEQAADKIDLVKCDVEGAELMVMRGATRLLSKDQPVLLLEVLRKWSRAFGYHPNDLIGLMAQYGYACFGVGKGCVRQIAAVDEDTLETNYIFATEAHVNERSILNTYKAP